MSDTTLETVVKEWMFVNKRKDVMDTSYERYIQIGIMALRDMRFSKIGNRDGVLSEAYLTVSDNDIAYLPDDFIDLYKVYVVEGGEKVAIGLNRNMPKLDTDNCGNIVVPNLSTDPDTRPLYPIYGANYSGGIAKDYGTGADGNAIGYYKLFADDGYIAFQGDSQLTKVGIDYVADLSRSSDGKFHVHPFLIDPIHAYLDWKDSVGMRSKGKQEELVNKQQYQRERLKAFKRYNKLNAVEITQMVKSGYRSSPKI